MGLAKGGNLKNAIVVKNNEILNGLMHTCGISTITDRKFTEISSGKLFQRMELTTLTREPRFI